MYVDLHCHILPGIDDGAKSVEDSLSMARQAVEEGVTHILCTPHHNNGVYLNPKNEVILRVKALQESLDEAQIPLTLLEGQEVRLSGDLVAMIDRVDILFADLSDTYVLIEFPSSMIPPYAEKVLFELCSLGYVPIIVHPERNAQIMKNPNELLPFIEMGCLGQVTNASFVGEFGKKVKKVADILVSHNLVHILSSDAHNTEHRGFFVKEAYALLEKEHGTEKKECFVQTAKDILNGERSRVLPAVAYKKKFNLFG